MLPIISTVLLVFALTAFLLGAIALPPPGGRVNYISLGLAFAALAVLLKL